MSNLTEKKRLTIEFLGNDNLYVNAQGVKLSDCAKVVGYAIRALAEENAKLHEDEVTPDYLLFVAGEFRKALFDGDFNLNEGIDDE